MCPNHELLSAWLDDEIPSPWKENMARHIEGCKSCEAVVAKLMSVREAFAADAADLDAISDKAKNRTYEKLEYRLHKPFGSNRAIKRLYIPIPMAMAAILAIAVLGFALLASQRRNSELRMAVLMAQEASSLVSSGLGIETVIDFVSRQNGAVNININLPSDVFGSARGEPVIIKEADLKPGPQMILWPLLLTGLLTFPGWSQEAVLPEPGSLAAIPPAMLEEALSISIDASINIPGEDIKWLVKEVKYTLPGASISIKLYGSDSAIIFTLTPHKRKKPDLLLIAQGQVWFKNKDSGVGYRTSVESLSINYGEKVLFYPFGANPPEGSPLRVEIVIEQYKNKDPKNQGTALPDQNPASVNNGTNP